ncbi:MAG: hypothetical protein AABW49_03665 [Nanoarchaeota archaeon]
MVNKQGYIKTIESVIAVVIILLVAYSAVVRTSERSPEVPRGVSAAQNVIRGVFEIDEVLRACVIDSTLCGGDSVSELVGQVIEDNVKNIPYDYAFRLCTDPDCVCDLENLCTDPSASCDPDTDCYVPTGAYPLEKEIYASDVFISSSVSGKPHRIIRFWFWKT